MPGHVFHSALGGRGSPPAGAPGRGRSGLVSDFFATPGWTQTFRVITRTVRDCRTAFVLFDSVYSEPGSEPLPLVIGVSFTRSGGRWLAVHNQDSQGPANPPNP